MRTSILVGATAAATVLLAGCATETVQPAPVQPVAATVAVTQTTACTRGAIDSQRVFILCPAESASRENAALAMKRPADLSLDIVSIADDYGIARQTVTGLEAATYARIVGKTPESAPRDPDEAASDEALVIEGREFRRVALETDRRKPVVLFVQK